MATNQAQWDNYRNNQRVVLQLPVSLVADNFRGYLFGAPKTAGRSLDASMTGMLIVTESQLPRQTKVRIRVNMGIGDDEGEVTLRGDVAWSRPDETGKAFLSGIRFHEKPRAAMKRWLAFVAERIRRYGGAA